MLQKIARRAATSSKHHGQVCDDRGPCVVHAQDEELRRRLGRLGAHCVGGHLDERERQHWLLELKA